MYPWPYSQNSHLCTSIIIHIIIKSWPLNAGVRGTNLPLPPTCSWKSMYNFQLPQNLTVLDIWWVLVCVGGGGVGGVGSSTPVDIKVPYVSVIDQFIQFSLHIHELLIADQKWSIQVFIEKKPMYMWICTVQAYILQGPTMSYIYIIYSINITKYWVFYLCLFLLWECKFHRSWSCALVSMCHVHEQYHLVKSFLLCKTHTFYKRKKENKAKQTETEDWPFILWFEKYLQFQRHRLNRCSAFNLSFKVSGKEVRLQPWW